MSLTKRSAPYRSNRSFLIFWHSDTLVPSLSARVPECQKINKGDLDQYGPEHFEV